MQREADVRKVISESSCKDLTEESYQDKIRGGAHCIDLHSNKSAHKH